MSSGGITRVTLAELPAPLGIDLAMMIEIQPSEFGLVHELRVTLTQADTAEDAAQFVFAFQVSSSTVFPGECVQLPVVAPIRHTPMSKHGPLDVKLSLNGEHAGHTTVYVVGPIADAAVSE